MNEQLIKLQKRLSELREEAAKPSTTEDRIKEIRAKVVSLEPQLRAELDKVESREGEPIAGLSDKVELREYLSAAIDGRPLKGAEKELCDERGLSDQNSIPWDALLPTLEERADDTTTAVGGIGANQATIMARVFDQTTAAFLGVRMPSVGVGDQNYPVITAGATGETLAAGASNDAEAATIGSLSLSPTRLGANYLIRVEDLARLRGMEAALRADLRTALGTLLDSQIIAGDGTSPNFDGLLNELADPTAAGDVIDYTSWIETLAAGIDGKYANQLNQVRAVVGTATYRKLASTLATNTAATALMWTGQNTGGVRASNAIPAPASNVQAGLRTVRGSDAIAPVWQGLSLIRDPYTDARSGKVRLTAFMLASFGMVREDAWAEISVKVA